VKAPLGTAQLAAEITRIELYPNKAVDRLSTLDIGRGRVTVIAGAPGAGKSSLIHRLLAAAAQSGARVAALLVDPSSSITGGAILGDRLRMLGAEFGERVFIRSLAASSGTECIGMTAPVIAWTLLNNGFDHVFIESVGIGQQELDVARRGDALVLVFGPDSGDWVQFIKSGVVELCNVIAVNKSDLGTDELVAAIRQSVRLQSFRAKAVDVVPVSSVSGAGVADLLAKIDEAHQMDDARRLSLRTSIVRDLLSRMALAATSARLDAHFSRVADQDWRAQAAMVGKFIKALPSIDPMEQP
jgi:LAO/AO transport system kinase